MLLKKCSNCHKVFPASDRFFWRGFKRPDGFQTYCKICDNSIRNRNKLAKERRDLLRQVYKNLRKLERIGEI